VSETNVIHVALVDDDARFLQFVLEALATEADMRVVASASTLADGRTLLDLPRVDVLVVDLGLPDGSGIELIREASSRRAGLEVLVSTVLGDEQSVLRSFEAGATGYLLKQHDAQRLRDDIRMMHMGGSPISPLMARKLLSRLQVRDDAPAPPEASGPAKGAAKVSSEDAGLSVREHEVLLYITKGFTAEEIAGLMGLSHHTVQTYIRRTYRKLNVRSRVEAIFEARVSGLIP
jgi:DNA-binding NarL/FixJ family response regulator